MKAVLSKCSFILLPIFLLTACSAGNSSVAHLSDFKICYGVASAWSINIYRKALEAAKISRGLNCEDYADQIATQLQLDRIEEKLEDIKNQAAFDKITSRRITAEPELDQVPVRTGRRRP